MSLFRPEALEARRRKLWGDIRLAQPPSLTVWTLVLTALGAGLIVLLATGSYTRKESVRGYLDSEAGIVEVRPLQQGRVARILVGEGESVEAGDPLIEFASDIEGLQGGPALDVQIAETDRQLAALAQRREAIEATYVAEQGRLADQIRSQQALMAITEAQQRGQADAVEIARADLERISQLQTRGFAPGSEVERRRRALLAEEAALRELDVAMATSQARAADLRRQVGAGPSRLAESDAILNGENARITQRRNELSLARGYVVRAPVSGVVTRLLAREGLSPANNAPLLVISPQGSMLFAKVLVPTRAVGFLKVGQPANLQIDAFPFQRFGMVQGYVTEIHPMVTRPGDIAYPIEQTEPVYEVDVFITREAVRAYGESRPLRPGMALQADLPIDRRRLWQQLFDPLLAAQARARK